jgi:hypothetical protein
VKNSIKAGMSTGCSRSGGHHEGHHVQVVIEVVAKPARFDHLREVVARRGHDAGVDVDRLDPAYAQERPVLQSAEKPRLDGGVHVDDVRQEQGAAVRTLERSEPHGAVVLAPEKLGDRITVREARDRHPDERPVAARAVLVQVARERLLADP